MKEAEVVKALPRETSDGGREGKRVLVVVVAANESVTESATTNKRNIASVFR